jgi:hypothetical protein
MEVILLERIERLGAMGDVVTVKPGFARNFLFPQKKALRANKDNKAVFESKRAELEANSATRRGEAEVVAKKMEGLKLIIVRQAGEGGQLYGSTSRSPARSKKPIRRWPRPPNCWNAPKTPRDSKPKPMRPMRPRTKLPGPRLNTPFDIKTLPARLS